MPKKGSASDQAGPTLPRIALLSLGGTIGVPVDQGGHGSSVALGAAELLAALPMLAGIADVEPLAFRTRMSADLAVADIVALAAEIAQLAAGGIDGVVVTQGTDTIEETAYLLDLLRPTDLPVVVTGAMRNPGKPGADGPANLVAAIRVAASAEAAGMGVLVVMDDTIHLARFVRKAHSFATGAFVSARVGPIGYVVEDRVRILLAPRRQSSRFELPDVVNLPDVALMTMSLGNDERLLGKVVEAGYRGLVIEAFGAGHVAAQIVPTLARLAQAIPVVFASRTGDGELYRATGSYPGSEGDLLARGLISAVGLDGRKARLLLTMLIATGASREAMVQAFEQASL